MKLKIYIVVSLLLFTLTASACGYFPMNSGNVWLYRIMPLDESRYEEYGTSWQSDCMLHPKVDYSRENVLLWQKQTSSSVSLKDIEHVVYQADIASLRNLSTSSGNNTFLRWVVENNKEDIVQLLIMAKQNESITSHMADPWYYRVEDDANFRTLENIAEECCKHKTGRLLGRYALQAMRALCNLRKYDECARYWYSVKNKIPDNVIRDMCELKAAAALNKTGRSEEALEIYARHGDVASIRAINNGEIDNELLFVYDSCPNSPYLEGELQKWLLYFGAERNCSSPMASCRYNEEQLDELLQVVHKAVREKKSDNMAMWYYTLAALYDVKGKPKQAKKYLNRGMSYRKNLFLRDSYRLLRMWLEAQTLPADSMYEKQLEADIRWLVAKVERDRPSGSDETKFEPEEFCYNRNYYEGKPNSFYWNDALRRLLLRAVCPKMHKAGKYVREIQLANLAENLLIHSNDYSNEMFLITDRLPYKAARDYFSRIYYPADDFDKFLNSKGKTDKYYWYDILATKCLRERRYDKAVVYLKQIPVEFQRKMNAYDYMDMNPFSYDMFTFTKNPALKDDSKLHFAQKMAAYRRVMNNDADADKRADAKIQYALGLRNSVSRCWFLTRYSSNNENNYIANNVANILYPEDTMTYRHDEYMAMSNRLISRAIAGYRDKEKAARQLQRLLYFRRVIDEFSETAAARDVRQHCDRWRDYANHLKKPKEQHK